MPEPMNLLDGLPERSPAEIVTELLAHSGVRIERIVSTGQTTPIDAPYDQDHDEWVLLLSGAAALWIDGEGEYRLQPGDAMLVKAHQRHRVTHTATDQPTVWLAIHLPPGRDREKWNPVFL